MTLTSHRARTNALPATSADLRSSRAGYFELADGWAFGGFALEHDGGGHPPKGFGVVAGYEIEARR